MGDFQSRERPNRRLKVDPAGKAAEPILYAIADEMPERADALLARVPRNLRSAVIVMIGRYFPDYRPPRPTARS